MNKPTVYAEELTSKKAKSAHSSKSSVSDDLDPKSVSRAKVMVTPSMTLMAKTFVHTVKKRLDKSRMPRGFRRSQVASSTGSQETFTERLLEAGVGTVYKRLLVYEELSDFSRKVRRFIDLELDSRLHSVFPAHKSDCDELFDASQRLRKALFQAAHGGPIQAGRREICYAFSPRHD